MSVVLWSSRSVIYSIIGDPEMWMITWHINLIHSCIIVPFFACIVCKNILAMHQILMQPVMA